MVHLSFQKFPGGITSLSTLRTTAVRSPHFQRKFCSSIFLINEFCFIVHSINYLKFKPAIRSIQAFPVFIIQLSSAFPSLSFFSLSSLGVLSTLEMHCKGTCIQWNYFPKIMFKLRFFTVLSEKTWSCKCQSNSEQLLCPSWITQVLYRLHDHRCTFLSK